MPAGSDLDRLVGGAPTTRRRGRMRRRLRHLRSVREVLLRDLGGLVFEVRRSGDDATAHQAIVDGKLTRIARVDAELRELEAFLDDRRGLIVREPGIGGTCSHCGELFGSDARFCWACGTPVAPGATRPPAMERALAAQIPQFVDGSGEELPLPPPPPPPPPPNDSPTVLMDAVTHEPPLAGDLPPPPTSPPDDSKAA